MGLCKILFPNIKTEKFVKPWFKLVHHLLKHNGTLYTVKHLKQMRLHITRYLCGQPLLINDCFVGLTKDG